MVLKAAKSYPHTPTPGLAAFNCPQRRSGQAAPWGRSLPSLEPPGRSRDYPLTVPPRPQRPGSTAPLPHPSRKPGRSFFRLPRRSQVDEALERLRPLVHHCRGGVRRAGVTGVSLGASTGMSEGVAEPDSEH
jgi:hypothetical protein